MWKDAPDEILTRTRRDYLASEDRMMIGPNTLLPVAIQWRCAAAMDSPLGDSSSYHSFESYDVSEQNLRPTSVRWVILRCMWYQRGFRDVRITRWLRGCWYRDFRRVTRTKPTIVQNSRSEPIVWWGNSLYHHHQSCNYHTSDRMYLIHHHGARILNVIHEDRMVDIRFGTVDSHWCIRACISRM